MHIYIYIYYTHLTYSISFYTVIEQRARRRASSPRIAFMYNMFAYSI